MLWHARGMHAPSTKHPETLVWTFLVSQTSVANSQKPSRSWGGAATARKINDKVVDLEHLTEEQLNVVTDAISCSG
jgi:hypothetical protein